MKILKAFLFSMTVICTAAYGQQADTLTLPGMKAIRNIRYGDADPKQNFDLYLPSRATALSPLVIWIHGGGWRMGTKKEMEIAYLAEHGYAIASVDYRFSRDSIFPAQVRDCNAAIAILWKNSANWGLDTNRFVVGGASAGGHLASLVALSSNNGRDEFYPYPRGEVRPVIRAVLDFYGPCDFYAFHGDNPSYKVDSAGASVPLLLGATALSRPDLAKWASPTTYVDRDDPPVLIFHGEKDPIVPLYLGQLFHSVLKTAGVRTRMVTLKDAGHGGPAFSGEVSRREVLSFLDEVWKEDAARSAVLPGSSRRGAGSVSSLDGVWTFSLDPMKRGETDGWYGPEYPTGLFDKVTVPHCFSVDQRYAYYTGKAWYFRKFGATAAVTGTHDLLKFDAVFYKAKVWLNGEVVGEHEGGYTPFELDVTGRLKDHNVLAVEVDNAWDTTTIPGAKTVVPYQRDDMSQQFPWINFGGITRPVSLVTYPDAYVKNISVETDPDSAKGKVRIRIVARLANMGAEAVRAEVKARVYGEGASGGEMVTGSSGNEIGRRGSGKELGRDGSGKEMTSGTGVFKSQSVALAAGAVQEVVFEKVLPLKDMRWWDQDRHPLYRAEVGIGRDTLSAVFGMRKLEVRGGRLLLNGEPFHMGGANRPLDHPDHGSMDPRQVLDKDLRLMKDGCMEFSRINHYPVPEYLLDWADRNGMLIIEEAGNWQMTPKQMSDPVMRKKFESQIREMIERDRNHPSIIAWSVGNEFQSQTEEGKSWVRDMIKFVKSLDSSRLVTFASMMVARDQIKGPDDEASQYVDFVSANMYGNYEKNLRRIHALYPGKPVFISEFGIRADEGNTDAKQAAHLQEAMRAFRQFDWLAGASIWTFQDYRSRFPGSNVNGYRPWGLVNPQREPRRLYYAWQEEFAPAVLEQVRRNGDTLTVSVTARRDFPSYTLRGYRLRWEGGSSGEASSGEGALDLPVLKPGERKEVEIVVPAAAGGVEVSLVKPGGFVILTKTFFK